MAVADHTIEKARKAAEQTGVDQSYADPAVMLQEASVDAIHNCTPNSAHAEVTSAALARGIHVLSEKPLGMASRESASLVQAASRADVVAGVCFNYRFYPLVREVRGRLATDGGAGRPHLIHGSYLQDWLLLQSDWNWRLEADMSGPSRALADIGSHWIDLVQYMTGDIVEEVFADIGRLHEHRFRPVDQPTTFAQATGGPSTATRIDTEDFGSVLLRFRSGCKGALTVSQVSAGRKNSLSFEIDTNEASFSWNQENPNCLWLGRRERPSELLLRDPSLTNETASAFSRLPAGHPEGWLDTLVGLFSDFYSAVVAKQKLEDYQPSFASFSEALRIDQTIEAMLRSAELGSFVTVGSERNV